jgi:hypothetical protein
MDANDQTATSGQDKDVWFFIPLPEPLGMPHGWKYGELLPRRELLASAGIADPVRCSLMIHQVSRTANVLLSDPI